MSNDDLIRAEDNSLQRPAVEFLGPRLVERILQEALEVLRKVGVYVEHAEALELLGDSGAEVDGTGRRARLPEELVWRCIRKVPAGVRMYDREGNPALQLEGRNVYFDPGSAALKILDSQTGIARPGISSDLVALSRLK